MSDIRPKISVWSDHYCSVSYKSFRENRGSSVGIANRLRAERPKTLGSMQVQETLLFFITSRQDLCPVQPPRESVTRALSQGIKLLNRETHRSPQTCAKVKSGGANPPICLHGVILK
jgi:hypothetical protein